MICPKCKKIISSGNNFCGYCGMKISNGSEETNEKVELKKEKDEPLVKSKVTMDNEEKLSPMNEAIKENHEKMMKILSEPIPQNKDKDASVIGRGIIGGVVAGPAGAVVGALSAVDKNNKKDK